MFSVIMLVRRVLFLVLFFCVFLLFGWVSLVAVLVVMVISLCVFVCVDLPCFCFLDAGSLYVGCVGITISGVSSCRVLLRVVGGGGCSSLVLVFLFPILLDFRGGMVDVWEE